jgi:malonyl-CoA/methylmalonyl-CoA synthetase
LNIYKIVGRTSVDVIKTGGYKVSALDVEKVVISNDFIEDVAVMGLNDAIWGQRVFALLVIKPEKESEYDEKKFVKWCQQNLPKYSVPTILRYIEKLPRNQLGKVNKKELINKYNQETLKEKN